MSTQYPSQKPFDGGDFSQAELLRGLQAYFGPREDQFLQALDGLRARLNHELKIALGTRAMFMSPQAMPKAGGCGFVAQAILDGVAELDLPVPTQLMYGLMKPSVTPEEAGSSYHFWVAVGHPEQRVAIDGAHPGKRRLWIAPETEHAEQAFFAPYRRGEQPGSPHEKTLDAAATKEGIIFPMIGRLSADVRAAFYGLVNTLTDEDTLTE